MHFLVSALIASVLGVVLQSSGVASQAPGGNADNGLVEYESVGCYQCHGYDALGPPRLAPDPLPFDAFSGYVRAPAGQMPPYTPAVLSDRQMADIYAFLESIPQPPEPDSIPLLSDID